MADAALDLHPVLLDLHPPTAAVAELAATEITIDRLAIELESRRQTLDDAGQPGSVRLARGGQLEASSG